MARKPSPRTRPAAMKAARLPSIPLEQIVSTCVAWLEARGSKQVRETIGPRYGLHVAKSFGVPIGTIHELAKALKQAHGPKGSNQCHAIAQSLWATGWYEARLLAAFIDDPARVTRTQMNRWAADFDNWGICDTACLHLFDKSEHAFTRIKAWAGKDAEFVKRASFALLASVALHDKDADDQKFLDSFPLIRDAASDERNFVKKAVSWAIRAIGKRSEPLRTAAAGLACQLSQSKDRTERWIGKDALRDLERKPKARPARRASA